MSEGNKAIFQIGVSSIRAHVEGNELRINSPDGGLVVIPDSTNSLRIRVERYSSRNTRIRIVEHILKIKRRWTVQEKATEIIDILEGLVE